MAGRIMGAENDHALKHSLEALRGGVPAAVSVQGIHLGFRDNSLEAGAEERAGGRYNGH